MMKGDENTYASNHISWIGQGIQQGGQPSEQHPDLTLCSVFAYVQGQGYTRITWQISKEWNLEAYGTEPENEVKLQQKS